MYWVVDRSHAAHKSRDIDKMENQRYSFFLSYSANLKLQARRVTWRD